MELEKTFVKDVYTQIASHFDGTRFCVWDFVKKFLTNKNSNMSGIDIGCGNGKNMLINQQLNIIGTDNCQELLDICKDKGLIVIKNDCCHLSFSNNTFDYAMSVAVFHHMGSTQRRNKALSEMIRVLKVGGSGMFSVWSIENQEKKRQFTEGNNFVNWERRSDRTVFKRFYYIFTRSMIDDLIENFTSEILINNIFNERGNWIVIFTKK